MTPPVAREPLRTANLVLEPLDHHHDADLLAATRASHDELLPWMRWAIDVTAPMQRSFTDGALIAWTEGSGFVFAITRHALAAGVISLIRRPGGSHEMDMGYWLRSDLTGRGYVTEAARALLAWGRDVVGVRRVILNAGIGNARSRAVARKLGFVRDGPIEGGLAGGNGVFPAYTHHLDL